MAHSLGLRLKTIQDLAQEAERRLELAKKATQDEAVMLRHREIRHFFDTAYAIFEHRLLNGKPPGVVYLGGRANRDLAFLVEMFRWKIPPAGDWRKGFGIWSSENQDYLFWQDFEARCTEQGLVPGWKYAYDGTGTSSWFELTVEPL